MKKFKRVFGFFMVVFILMLSTGCKNKKEMFIEDFKKKMESNGYYVQEVTNQFSNYNYINKVYIAQSKDKTFQIEFYSMNNDESAISFYEHNKSILESNVTSSKTSVNVANYMKFSQTSNGKYSVVSRIGKSVLYVNANDKYKTEIKKVLNELGY